MYPPHHHKHKHSDPALLQLYHPLPIVDEGLQLA